MKPLLALAFSLCLPGLSIAQEANPSHAPQADAQRTAHAIDAGQIWGADYFPNVELTTHEGQHVRFFDDLLKGKVVLINFIYTSCPDACPLETARIAEVYDLLKDRVGKDVHFYSISVDPEVDTPQVLAEYAQRFHVGPGWKFLTGTKADIRLVREKLGMIRAEEQSLADHTLSLMIGNQATGRWMKRSPTENPYMLATQLGSWLHDWKISSDYLIDFKDAPLKLRNMSPGEELFRTRCGACHLVGADDGIPRSGPNLLGVHQRRDPVWLARWIAAGCDARREGPGGDGAVRGLGSSADAQPATGCQSGRRPDGLHAGGVGSLHGRAAAGGGRLGPRPVRRPPGRGVGGGWPAFLLPEEEQPRAGNPCAGPCRAGRAGIGIPSGDSGLQPADS